MGASIRNRNGKTEQVRCAQNREMVEGGGVIRCAYQGGGTKLRCMGIYVVQSYPQL